MLPSALIAAKRVNGDIGVCEKGECKPSFQLFSLKKYVYS